MNTGLWNQEKFNTELGTIPFSQIKEQDYIPALKEKIKQCEENLKRMKEKKTISFNEVFDVFENNYKSLSKLTHTFSNLFSAHSTETLRGLAEEFNSIKTKYDNNTTLDPQIFSQVKKLYEQIDQLKLETDQKKLLSDTYRSFVRNGALLSEANKQKIRDIDDELTKLSVAYSNNVLKATNEYKLVIKDRAQLEGLTPDFITSSIELANNKGISSTAEKGPWVVTLDYPSYLPFMMYSTNTDLKKEISQAQGTLCYKGEQFNNIENCKRITNLKYQRAQILGFDSHASFVLQERMAETKETVFNFLEELLKKSLPKAKKEMEAIALFKKKKMGDATLESWDVPLWSRLYKQDNLGFDEEDLKPYFELENTIKGVFHIAHKLYNLKFELLKNVDVYHEDVKVYKVTDEKGDEFVGIIYMDFFPRESKRGGAWMCEYQGQYIENQYDHRPHVGIVCNFTKPMASKPSLLTFSEVTTLFHEFGHALHGLLTKCRYLSQSGANVLWDFVELPSQVMENWCYEKEALDLFAKHYQSGEKIPDSLLKKLCDSRQFLEAIATVRQLYFAFLDFEWHAGNPEAIKDIGLMEKKLREKTKTYHFPTDRDVSQSTHFGHIFGGGYSAGYYSYKWAEVLDADAFEYFKQNGIFNQNIAKSFRENILAKGDTIHPMELYKKFRGKKPEIEPLLRRAGLLT